MFALALTSRRGGTFLDDIRGGGGKVSFGGGGRSFCGGEGRGVATATVAALGTGARTGGSSGVLDPCDFLL